MSAGTGTIYNSAPLTSSREKKFWILHNCCMNQSKMSVEKARQQQKVHLCIIQARSITQVFLSDEPPSEDQILSGSKASLLRKVGWKVDNVVSS